MKILLGELEVRVGIISMSRERARLVSRVPVPVVVGVVTLRS